MLLHSGRRPATAFNSFPFQRPACQMRRQAAARWPSRAWPTHRRCYATSRGQERPERSSRRCKGDPAELHLPAKMFSARKSNSLSGTPACFMIAFQGQDSAKSLHQIEISTMWWEMTPLHTKATDGWKKIRL